MNRFKRRAATYPGALEAARRELRTAGPRLSVALREVPESPCHGCLSRYQREMGEARPPAITYARGRRRGERCRDSYFR